MKYLARGLFTCSVFTVLGVVQAVQAGQAEIIWSQSEEYTDMVPSKESKQALEKRVFNSLDKYWRDLAQQLPAGYKLQVTFTDVDLAGKVIAGKTRKLDVLDFPQMTFNYSLQTPTETLIPTTQAHIKSDMSYLHDIPRQLKNESFSAEKSLIKDWFDSVFTAYLVKE